MKIHAFLLSLFAVVLLGFAAAQPAMAQDKILKGSDIAPALALGARAVLVGRAHLYGLAAAGEPGVRHAIDILAGQLRTSMALCGAAMLAM